MISDQIPGMAEEVAAEIEKRGWTRGCYEDSQGRVCLVGAMSRVFGEISLANGALYDVIAEYINDIPQRWNDYVADSQFEVIEMLHNVAIKYRSDEMVMTD